MRRGRTIIEKLLTPLVNKQIFIHGAKFQYANNILEEGEQCKGGCALSLLSKKSDKK